MLVMPQCYSAIIDHGTNATGHNKEVVNGINSINKIYIYQLMSNVQLLGSKTFDLQILMHSCTPKNDVSLAKEFQKYMSKENRKHGVIYQVNTGKYPVK